ncbi:MAG TPA: hypothetical protein VNA22_01890 [Pyrinomonadaceae bacterium]|nr:hypothetical protein [Pyrinomonadaceae bacterium]
MGFTKESATERAKQDLAGRLDVDASSIEQSSVEDREFPDMSLGAATEDEMAAQMISSGWEITLGVGGKSFEYRADKYQLRLVDYKGANHVIE